MVLKEITIINFRNYKQTNLSFSPNINIIYGNNGEGKTNLLESIYVLGLTKSYKSSSTDHLINKKFSFARLSGIVEKNKIKTNLEIIMEPSKKYLKKDENKIGSISDYISEMNVIIFSPDDLELIKGSPLERRKYLDIQLSQINLKYFKLLNEYNKILKQRNELLKRYSKTKIMNKEYFEIITESLVKRGFQIYQFRDNYIKNINKNIENIYYNITTIKDFKILYKPFISNESNEKSLFLKKYREQLKSSYEHELKIGSTLIGPHRDDFDFRIKKNNLKYYGSQGQQRSAVLSLKLSEIPIFKKHKNSFPILLLDDVFSELDDLKKNNLLKYIVNNLQIFITTTDLKSIKKSILQQANIIKIEEGNIVCKREV